VRERRRRGRGWSPATLLERERNEGGEEADAGRGGARLGELEGTQTREEGGEVNPNSYLYRSLVEWALPGLGALTTGPPFF
jgi:hypothetical protein